MDFISKEEELFWQERNCEFKCKALETLCGKRFNKHPIFIEEQECYGEETGEYYVSLDVFHDITHVYDANKKIYNIPQIKDLLDEREQCSRIIEETNATLTKIGKETFYLGNLRQLDEKIEKLFRERVEQIPKLGETIKKNQERINQIKKELTNVFAEFLRKH